MSSPIEAPEGEGKRNHNCPHYRACLNLAAYRQWPGWTCEYCPHRTARVGPPGVLELFGYYLLAIALFKPSAYKIYLADKKGDLVTEKKVRPEIFL